MKKIDIRGKRVRIFFHTDLDGVVGAIMLKFFCGVDVVKLVPAYPNYPKPESLPGVLDVFVDCRARDKDEDIRIDHHTSKDDNKEYLEREGIIVEPKFKSIPSLIAKLFNLNINPKILKLTDDMDSGRKNILSTRKISNSTLYKLFFKPGLKISDFENYDTFLDKLYAAMPKGGVIHEEIKDLDAHEKFLKKKFGVVFEEVPGKSTKIVYTPVKEGFFREKVFKMNGAEFDEHILSYLINRLYIEAKKAGIVIYTVCGFRKLNERYDDKLIKIEEDTNQEPYQIFAARSENATINIGELIQAAKDHTGITNGGGREFVGGMNTSDKKKAIKALRFMVKHITKHCP